LNNNQNGFKLCLSFNLRHYKEEAEARRKAGNDDLSLRAIHAMMDGTLEQKRKGFLLEREPWWGPCTS
jgi:hypothetical protein